MLSMVGEGGGEEGGRGGRVVLYCFLPKHAGTNIRMRIRNEKTHEDI